MRAGSICGILLFLSIIPFLFPALLYAEISGTDLAPENSYDSGAVVVRPLRIDYTGDADVSVSLNITLPERWQILVPQLPLQFNGPGTELVLLNFHIPATAAAGDYAVKVSLGAEGEVLQVLSLPVTVRELPSLECELVEDPGTVLAGSAYEVYFHCRNNGNVPLSVIVEASSSKGFDLRLESGSIFLLPGASTMVGVLVDTPISLTKVTRHLLRMQLFSREYEKVQASSVSILDIIPRSTGTFSRYNSLPGTMDLRGVFQHSETDTFGLEGRVSGEGYLDEEESTLLSYSLRRPVAGAGTLIPDRSEYYLGLRGEDYNASLGTQYFSLSPLVAASQYGTGIALGRNFGKLQVEGYAMDRLLFGENESRTGSKISYRLSDRGAGAFNFLHVTGEEIWSSLGAEIHTLTEEGARLGWEYASSSGERMDDAMRANLGWSEDRFACSVRYLRAGPYFQGPIADRDEITATLNYRPSDTLSLKGLVASKSYNLVQSIPARFETAGLSALWRPATRTTLSADIRNSLEKDLADSYDSAIYGERYRFGLSRSSGAVQYSLAFDSKSDLEVKESLRTWSQGASLQLKAVSGLLGNFSSGIAVQWRDGDAGTTPSSDFTLGWEKSINSRSRLSVKYRTINNYISWYDGSDSLLITYGFIFPDQGKLAIAADYGPNRTSGNSGDITLSLSFSQPYNLPVSLKKDKGVVEGKVINRETGRAMPDVILRMEERVVASDTFGMFRFHGLSEGSYRLSVDPASLPVDMLPDERMPAEIEVDGGSIIRNINLVKAATLSGRVLQYRFDEASQWAAQAGGEEDPYKEPEGMAGILLTLKGPRGLIRRAVSGIDGRFTFPPLIPGTWSLVMPDDAVPEGFFLAKGNYDFPLSPGSNIATQIRFFPKARKIRFIDTGMVVQEVEIQEPPEPENPEEPQNPEELQNPEGSENATPDS